MADEETTQEPQGPTGPQEPTGQQQPEGVVPEGTPTDRHGQEGISKAKYERERRQWEDKVKALQAKLDGTADEGDRVARLEGELRAMQDRLADERVTSRLVAAGCVNPKAAKAVLEDYDGDVDRLRDACPYLFQQRKRTGSTGGSPAGAASGDDVAKARKAAGLPPRKQGA